MGYYKVLLADDEKEIREGMINKLDWNALGFEIVASAENGIEALELLEQTRPHVIVTDIKMPYVNGLDFVEKAVEILPTVKIIVFSGFEDFEYAQRAIKLNVEEYMLKPILSRQFKDVLENLKQKMDEEIENKRNMAVLKENYEKSMPVMRENFLVSWVEGHMCEKNLIARAKTYNIDMEPCFKAVVLISADQSPILDEGGESRFKGREELIPIALKKIVDITLCKFHRIYSFMYGENIVAIVELKWKTEITRLMNEVKSVCKEGKSIINMEIAAGIGGIYKKPIQVKQSYKEACSALEYSALLNNEGARASYIKDIEPNHTVNVQFGEKEERVLMSAINLGDEERIEKRINGFFASLEESNLPYHFYQIYIMEIFTMLMKILNTYKLDISNILGSDFKNISSVLGLHSLNQTRKWFIQSCLRVSDYIQKERSDSGKIIVLKAKSYVEEHYTDGSLTADKVCQELHVSPAYFSTIFKKETGNSFVSYLTEKRLNKAVSLLSTTSEKTYIIGQKVGYLESNYFSYVFKKKYGIAPSKYRKQLEDDTLHKE